MDVKVCSRMAVPGSVEVFVLLLLCNSHDTQVGKTKQKNSNRLICWIWWELQMGQGCKDIWNHRGKAGRALEEASNQSCCPKEEGARTEDLNHLLTLTHTEDLAIFLGHLFQGTAVFAIRKGS